MDYPLSLEQTTLVNWAQCVVPGGQHRGKTFEQVVECGAAARYRNRVCSSEWAKSLCAYVKALGDKCVRDDGYDIVRGRDLDDKHNKGKRVIYYNKQQDKPGHGDSEGGGELAKISSVGAKQMGMLKKRRLSFKP